LGSSFKPDFGKPDVGRAHFRGVRFARPSEALFGHGPILAGRFHDKTSLAPNSVPDFAEVVCISGDLSKVIHNPLFGP
jgi:hypothetical protein